MSSWIIRSPGSDSQAGKRSDCRSEKRAKSAQNSSTSSARGQRTTSADSRWVSRAAASSAHDEPQTPSKVPSRPARSAASTSSKPSSASRHRGSARNADALATSVSAITALILNDSSQSTPVQAPQQSSSTARMLIVILDCFPIGESENERCFCPDDT